MQDMHADHAREKKRAKKFPKVYNGMEMWAS